MYPEQSKSDQNTSLPFAARVECSRDTHHPLSCSIDTPNLELVSAALRDCGRTLSPEVLAYVVDALSSGDRLHPHELSKLGAESADAEFGEIRSLRGGGTVLIREMFIDFYAEDDGPRETWMGEDLLRGARLVFSAGNCKGDGRFELTLKVQELEYSRDTASRRWEIISTFADYFSEHRLPDTIAGVVLPSDSPGRSTARVGALEIALEDVRRDAGIENDCRTESPFDDRIVRDIRAQRLAEILDASGLQGVSRQSCEHLIAAVRFGTSIEAERLNFMRGDTPVTVIQTLSLAFDPEERRWEEDNILDWETDDPKYLGGLRFCIVPTKLSSEGMALQLEAALSWDRADEFTGQEQRALLQLLRSS